MDKKIPKNLKVGVDAKITTDPETGGTVITLERRPGHITPAAMVAAMQGNAENFDAAMTPGGIERQEAAGQAALCASSRLPREGWHPGGRELAEKHWGIKFGKEVDELFVEVTLPAGWKLQPTDHSMHNDLLDDKGRKRAHIFYKAAFYDRRADIRLNSRYYVHCDFLGDHETGTMAHKVMDRATGKAIKEWPEIKQPDPNREYGKQQQEAWDFLKLNYPDENPYAYWDENPVA